MSDPKPCGGTIYYAAWLYAHDDCTGCTQTDTAGGKCLGPDGYRWMALVASEVAAERAETLRLTALAFAQNGIRALPYTERVYSETGP